MYKYLWVLDDLNVVFEAENRHEAKELIRDKIKELGCRDVNITFYNITETVSLDELKKEDET